MDASAKVDLEKASLRETTLSKADLENANLLDATLEKASLTGADLTGANLRRAKYDSSTVWPHDAFNLRASGATLVEVPSVPVISKDTWRP